MKKLLIVNSFPFHFELFGFILSHLKYRWEDNDYKLDVYNPYDKKYEAREGYSELGLEYKLVNEICKMYYDLIFVMTDSDPILHELEPKNVIVFEHWYKRRISKEFLVTVPVGPFFGDGKYSDNFALPVFVGCDLNSKKKLYTQNKITVTILGRDVPRTAESIFTYFRNSELIHINVVTQIEERFSFEDQSCDIKVFRNISMSKLFHILANTHYVFISDICQWHLEGYSISSSIAHAYSFLCQLIVPRGMISNIRFKSPIYYDMGSSIELKVPDFDQISKERNELTDARDRILNMEINRLTWSSASEIPKRIYQYCFADYNPSNIPSLVRANIVSHNPSHSYELQTESEIKEMLAKTGVERSKYSQFPDINPAIKKDFLMMIKLYNEGGIHFDLDQKPEVGFDPVLRGVTFSTCITADPRDGITTGFVACTQSNEITKKIIVKYLEFDFHYIQFRGYTALCQLAGEALKEFMGVVQLREGLYEVKGEKILIMTEIIPDGILKNAVMSYRGELLFRSHYTEYPWNLKSNK